MTFRGPPLIVLEDVPPGLGHSSRKTDDDSSSSQSRTTVLSARSFDFNLNTDDESVDSNIEMFDYVALEREWEELQKRCSRRDRTLRRMAESKSPEFIKLLQRHEFKVRRQEYKQLFLRHLRDESLIVRDDDSEDAPLKHKSRKGRDNPSVRTDDGNDDDTSPDIWFDTCSESGKKLSVDPDWCFCDSTHPKGPGWNSKLRDFALFEWHTTAPAVMSLVVHCFGHSALFDGIEILSEEFKKYCEMYGAQTWPVRPEIVALTVMFTIGLTMLRMSGFLYWWLNEADFLCLKFDYHNRSRLECWDARFLLWIKRHPVFQAFLYFTGYQLIFMVVNEIFYYSFYLFDQRQTILDTLPSEMFFKDTGRFPAAVADCEASDSCDDDLVVLSDEVTSLLSKDIRYLWKKLIFSSFETFCYDWVTDLAGEDERPLPLLTPSTAVFLCMCTLTLCVTILKRYGFGVFEKY